MPEMNDLPLRKGKKHLIILNDCVVRRYAVEEGECVMAEYIERDKLLKFKADVYDEDGHVLYAVPTGYIVAMPHDDVAPMRHGQWMQVICHEEFEDGFVDPVKECCSVCHAKNWQRRTNYYHHCGAKMEGGVENDRS